MVTVETQNSPDANSLSELEIAEQCYCAALPTLMKLVLGSCEITYQAPHKLQQRLKRRGLEMRQGDFVLCAI